MEYILNPKNIDEIKNNAVIQLNNISYYISINDFESAQIKAAYLISELNDIQAYKMGIELSETKTL
jgi:ABC-type xylose transport system substrate-binding protein